MIDNERRWQSMYLGIEYIIENVIAKERA